jgi:prenyltransferase beta subunit
MDFNLIQPKTLSITILLIHKTQFSHSPSELFNKTAHWVLQCQTYEGGFGGFPGMEAHGGYCFCGLVRMFFLSTLFRNHFEYSLHSVMILNPFRLLSFFLIVVIFVTWIDF